jgi:hypothetical protein
MIPTIAAAIATMLKAIVLCLVVPISRYYPLAKPKTKPAETLDTSGIPIFDNIPE